MDLNVIFMIDLNVPYSVLNVLNMELNVLEMNSSVLCVDLIVRLEDYIHCYIPIVFYLDQHVLYLDLIDLLGIRIAQTERP